ncbi:two-component system, NarL family, response regulator DegU [Oceanobacillus limi]|uniref:Two-component system, NarL family, response regulator DegU n=1 Tax=Oceanobacillus limi TaxID=930131 RepID=A0A1I0BLJ1_9BACI|nr:response regulator transcription factor [Oceanobacillus limi]SET07825.1 two-component system, NarL family, response regulator DegU [Oceanobacillus limi]
MSEIVLVKENDLIREGIMSVLQAKLPEYVISAITSEEEIEALELTSNDLLIIDVEANVDVSKIISRNFDKNVKIAVWSADIENNLLIDLFKLGLHGYFYNGMETSELVFAIKTMLNGQQYIHPQLSSILLNEYIKVTNSKPTRPNGVLTQQEWNILEEIVKGNKNCSIAENLYISTRTVNNHVSSILKKLHVSDRTSAAILAVKNNWVNIKDS